MKHRSIHRSRRSSRRIKDTQPMYGSKVPSTTSDLHALPFWLGTYRVIFGCSVITGRAPASPPPPPPPAAGCWLLLGFPGRVPRSLFGISRFYFHFYTSTVGSGERSREDVCRSCHKSNRVWHAFPLTFGDHSFLSGSHGSTACGPVK
jgi:hypothetical protein